jgi:RimJ/RimL family protein N-acetyltransferase
VVNPVLLDFPEQFTTKRPLIRMAKPGDGKYVNEAITASIHELQPWLPFAQKVPSLEETEENIRQAHADFILRKDLQMHIFHKQEGFFFGSTGFHNICLNVPKFEIGYWVDSRHSMNGYITETVQGLTVFAFEHLQANRIEIRCDERNIRSRKIPERLDFQLEGILKKS